MTSTSGRLVDYVSGDERLLDVSPAEMTVPDHVYQEPAAVGITDRRLVLLSDAGEFTSIPHDHVSSIRSVRMQDIGYRGNDYRLLLAGSALLAGVVLSVATVLLTGLVAMGLFLLAVGGILMLYYSYQGRPAGLTERLGTLDYWEVSSLDDRDRLLAGGGVLTVLALSGIVVLTPSVSSVAFTLAIVPLMVGSVWLADYAWQHRSDLDGIEVVRTNRKVVHIGTYSGNTVSILIDPSDDLDQTLSKESHRIGTDTSSDRPPKETTQER